jgi:hypothetical protein
MHVSQSYVTTRWPCRWLSSRAASLGPRRVGQPGFPASSKRTAAVEEALARTVECDAVFMTSPNTRARAPLAGASLRLLGGRHQGFVVLPSRGGGERGEKFFSGKLAGAFTAKECPCTVCLLTFFANGEYELDKTRPRSEALVREGHVARPGGSGEEGGSAPVRPEVRSFVRVRTTTPRGVYVGAGCFSPPTLPRQPGGV